MGFFRLNGPLLFNRERPLPHPQSPAVRTLAPLNLAAVATHGGGGAAGSNGKPPPLVTADTTQTIHGARVTIKADLYNVAGLSGAKTEISVSFQTPDIEFDTSADQKITRFSGQSVSFEIQTSFGDGKPTDRSAYGRGATEQDVKDGNTSLGFHESRHREDFLSSLRAKAPPSFGGKVRMKKKDFDAAVQKWINDLESYRSAIADASEASTDEVGNPTRANYCLAHPAGVCE